MLAQERYEAILGMFKKNNIVKINDIVEKLGISNETARRDLDVLQEQNLLKRIHGGAMMTDKIQNVSKATKSIPAVGKNYTSRKAIGKAAAALIKDGETIYLDVGSTVLQIATNLKKFKNLTVITDSLGVANELTASDVKVILLGGKLLHDDQLMYSPFTAENFERFYVDKAFFSCGGMTISSGVTDYNEDILSRKLIKEHSNETFLCLDSTKFGKISLVKMCELSELTSVITDSGIPQEYVNHFGELGIRTIIAECNDKEKQPKEQLS